MPRPMKIWSYPESIQSLYGMLQEVPEMVIDFPDERAAKAWRFDFYGYREAIRRANPNWDADFPLLGGITLRVLPPDGEKGWRLRASIADDDWVHRRMLKELERQKAIKASAGAVPVSTERQDDGELER